MSESHGSGSHASGGGSGSSSGGGFWSENKGSIMSGLGQAAKLGYRGTKFIAKTGYKAGKAGKAQYDKSRNNKKKGHDEADDEYKDDEFEYDREERRGSFTHDHAQNANRFGRPPLREDRQQQYGYSSHEHQQYGDYPPQRGRQQEHDDYPPQRGCQRDHEGYPPRQQYERYSPQQQSQYGDYPNQQTQQGYTPQQQPAYPPRHQQQQQQQQQPAYPPRQQQQQQQQPPPPVFPPQQQTPSPGELQPLYNANGEIIGYVPVQQNGADYFPQSATFQGQQPSVMPSRAAHPLPPHVQGQGALPQQETLPRMQHPLPTSSQGQQSSYSERAPQFPEMSTANNFGASPMYAQQQGQSAYDLNGPAPNSSSSALITNGPIVETNPYVWKDEETRKEEKKLPINMIDISKLAPPPKHVARGPEAGPSFSEEVTKKYKSPVPGEVTEDSVAVSQDLNKNANNNGGRNTNHSKIKLRAISPEPISRKPTDVSVSSSINSGFPARREDSTDNIHDGGSDEDTQALEKQKVESDANEPKILRENYNYKPNIGFAPPPPPPGSSERFSASNTDMGNGATSLATHSSASSLISTSNNNSNSTTSIAKESRSVPKPPLSKSISSFNNLRDGSKRENGDGPQAAVLGSNYNYNKLDVNKFAPPPKPYRNLEQQQQQNEKNFGLSSNSAASVASTSAAPSFYSGNDSVFNDVPSATPHRRDSSKELPLGNNGDGGSINSNDNDYHKHFNQNGTDHSIKPKLPPPVGAKPSKLKTDIVSPLPAVKPKPNFLRGGLDTASNNNVEEKGRKEATTFEENENLRHESAHDLINEFNKKLNFNNNSMIAGNGGNVSDVDNFSMIAKNKKKKAPPPVKPKKKMLLPGSYVTNEDINTELKHDDDNPFSVYSRNTVPTEYNRMNARP
ncbi:Aim3p SCDLUD_000573 [Saccharomycodes ludwigii]|uniref:Aim3p n=1 Tax=Saccharomycodes ludwigii TaxID=36035 RepID=UPI001E8346BB|nr:hypothetical protein SCDLUD_000573 [Saccharomycodes ludwigii]KAH3902973.1 hypothetical protein SCDLUD_000573 [Saccharomycodes ludwigii]